MSFSIEQLQEANFEYLKNLVEEMGLEKALEFLPLQVENLSILGLLSDSHKDTLLKLIG